MRRMVWSLMSVAALALAGCNGSNAPEQGNSDAAAHSLRIEVSSSIAGSLFSALDYLTSLSE